MPRLPPALLRRAHHISPLLPPLVRTTRSFSDAIQELRWLRAHAAKRPNAETLLRSYIYRRSALLEPLQYILGSQPFGPTEILCRRGVLIPRPETEETASHLASLFASHVRKKPKLVDLCTGTGCIPLLIAAETEVLAVGVDISPHALDLAMENLAHNQNVLEDGSKVNFIQGDILTQDEDELQYNIYACFDEMDTMKDGYASGDVDVVVSNPPYISIEGYARETSRSVRNWEPKLALEAGDEGDAFYPKIGRFAWELGARAVVTEVGGWAQAARVKACFEEMGWVNAAIWKDFAGRGRTVVAWRKGGEWIKHGPNS